MKKTFLLTLLTALSIFANSCAKAEEPANTVVVEPTVAAPLYTDAATALEAGNKFFDENNIEKAIEAYRFATKANPDLGEAHFKLGIAYAQLESEQELIVTPVEQPNTNEEKPKKGEKPKEEKKSNSVLAFENAVTAYKKQLKENPKDEVAHFNLGRVYERLNEDEDSRKSLEEAVKLKPEDSQYQTELGRTLVKLAQYDEAVKALKKALELDESNAQAIELMDKAAAGKKRVDFGVDQLTKNLKTGVKEPEQPVKSNRKGGSTRTNSTETETKPPVTNEPDRKSETPKPPTVQPKKPDLRSLK
jgi:tetratricopeptide (TPR) repeat protein